MEKFISVPWGNTFLMGVLSCPNETSDKLVLFVHGIPGDRVDARRLPVRIARFLSKSNIASLRIDLYASGISEGHFENVTLGSQKEQIECVINYIKSELLFDDKIIIVAFSEAAKIVNAIAKERQEIVGICYCNGILVREAITDSLKIKRLYKKNDAYVANIGFGVWLNSKIIAEIEQWSLNDVNDLANVRTLFIYGDEDDLTWSSRQLVSQNVSESVQLDIIKGADHLFTNSTFDEILISKISHWLNENTF